MSRTFKDKPHKLRGYGWDYDTIRVPCTRVYTLWSTKELKEIDTFIHLQVPTTKTKKRKELDTEDHWMTTPGWWVKLTMTRPERRFASVATHKLLRLADLDDADIPDLGRKPHNYYW